MTASRIFCHRIVKYIIFITVTILFSKGLLIKGETPPPSPNALEMQRLRSDLLKSYDKTLRPVKNESVVTKVELLFDVRHIVDLDEKYQILSVKGVLMMKWHDEHLKWDPSNYNSISSLHCSPSEVWIPDVHSIYNVKAVDIYNKKQTAPVVISSDGSVKWYPAVVFDVPCSTQLRHYPFDGHNCSILFIAWTHNSYEITVETLSLPVKQSLSVRGTEWILNEITHETIDWRVGAYYRLRAVKVELYMHRASRIYRYICVVPTLVSILSTMFGFWLLSGETARYMIGCLNVILMAMLLQYLATTVPAGKELPLIVQYSAACLCMSAIFLLVTIVTDLLQHCSRIAPTILVRLARSTLDRILFLSLFWSGIQTDGFHRVDLQDHEKRKQDWLLISLLVDRSCFLAFGLIYTILIAVIASV